MKIPLIEFSLLSDNDDIPRWDTRLLRSTSNNILCNDNDDDEGGEWVIIRLLVVLLLLAVILLLVVVTVAATDGIWKLTEEFIIWRKNLIE